MFIDTVAARHMSGNAAHWTTRLFRVATIRMWFLEQHKPMPVDLIAKAKPIACTCADRTADGRAETVVATPLFVAVLRDGVCVSVATFAAFNNRLENRTIRQTAPHYALNRRCYNVSPGAASAPRLHVLDPQRNTLVPVSAPCPYPEDVLVAHEVLDNLRRYFVPRHGYGYQYGEEAYEWQAGRGIAPVERMFLLLRRVRALLLRDETAVKIVPPAYVVGDLHGNFRDLATLCKLFRITPASGIATSRYLFLGDYVDRGPHQLELAFMLFALKTILPHNVFLLRGNHESRRVNGAVAVYGRMSFLARCYERYGKKLGYRLWAAVNDVFDALPFCAVVDNAVFCVHGGIARELCGEHVNALERLDAIARPCEVDTPLASDLTWCDPADTSEETALADGGDGFGPNRRGKGAFVFGNQAIDRFMRNSGCRYIVRAHQTEEMGVGVRKNGRVITVFSTSHYCGTRNSAAGLLVSRGLITALTFTGKVYVRGKEEGGEGWWASESTSMSEVSRDGRSW